MMKKFSYTEKFFGTCGNNNYPLTLCHYKMDGVRIPMEKTASLLKWNLAGEVLIPDVLNEDEIENTDGCRLATELAHKF